MDLIFLSFANSREDPLPTLKEEEDTLYGMLARRMAMQHFTIHRDGVATTSSIAEYLLLYKDFISVFVFSGHAGRDKLFASDGDANALGIASLLGQCPRLKLVILNGCSTQGQVAKLIALPSKPVVIATSAPVKDRSATQFSTSFFQSLSEQSSNIKEAFAAGLAAAQTVSDQPLNEKRGSLDLEDETDDQNIWGIFPAEGTSLDWTLPTGTFDRKWLDFKPNQMLYDQLLKAYAAFNKDAQKILDDEDMGFEGSLRDKRKAILSCLPHPISLHLSKLFAPAKANTNMTFYDKLGIDRLAQMAITYNTTIEFITFVMLAQLWDALSKKEPIHIKETYKKTLKGFFLLDNEQRKQYAFFELIHDIRQIFEENNIPFFIREIQKISQVFNEQSQFYFACLFMETVKKRLAAKTIGESEAMQLCMLAEDKLALILEQIGFTYNYTLTSVKSIDVIKYRHLPNHLYKHKFVKLTQDIIEPSEDVDRMPYVTDISSVILVNEKEDDIAKKFLNLTPFIIDENAFDPKAVVAKLQFFDHYNADEDTYFFRHVYNPADPLLAIADQRNYKIVKVQFNEFAKLLFQQPMASV
ncbi:MAG: hypothetical protein DHS20C18_17170 [Saprospiraceae bacterium]|nr:MAG: hypothetical protein DHS20C18_17170 [Saprospiraceae bacterium]